MFCYCTLWDFEIQIGCWQCCYHEELIKLIEILTTGDEEGEVFPNFELFPYFNIDVQPELVNNNFIDEKESLISSKKCKQQQFKKRNLTWDYGIDRWLQSTEGNDFSLRRTMYAPTWADLNLLLHKEMTSNVYNTKRSSTEWFHVHTRASEKGGKMKWRACPTANKRTGFLPVT